MNHPNRIVPVIYGSITMTMLAVLPLVSLINLFCCAGIMIGGAVGVYTYWRQLHDTGIPLTAKDGGMIGILCGILSAVFVTGIGLLVSLFSESNPMLEVLKAIDELGISIPPEMNSYIEKFSNEYSEHGFSPSITLISFVSNLIIYPLFGAAGALLAVNYFARRNSNIG